MWIYGSEREREWSVSERESLLRMVTEWSDSGE